MKDDPLNRLDSPATLPRRTFLKGVLAGSGLLAAGGTLSAAETLAGDAPAPKPAFRGPNVILVRFGGGARRRETIDPQSTYSPFLCRELAKRGTFFKNMDRKSTRLNSSHLVISYAVFCLKKKKNKTNKYCISSH